jgi:hypothetical protein
LQSCQQLHPDPKLGPLNHDHKLTLIFFSLREGDLLNPWIKRGDPTVIWPQHWLPKEEEGLGDNILVLSVECYVDRKKPLSVPVPLERILVRDLVMKYVCSHLNALLGSFLGVVASWGSTCDLIMLAVCFAVYVLLYTLFRQGHFTELLSSSENDLNNSQPLKTQFLKCPKVPF